MHLNLDESNELLILDGQIIAICWLISAIIIASGVEHKHIFETTNQTISAFSEAKNGKMKVWPANKAILPATHMIISLMWSCPTRVQWLLREKTLFLTYR